MSAVKNLRAMFEQKADTSPPDRGRSPGLSSGTETPPPARPLSKIRTSFVAIEKDGRMGLRRDPSNDSNGSLSQRRLSGHTEGEASVSGLSDKTIATEDTSVGYKTNIVGSPIPESPRRPDTDKPTNGASPQNFGALTDHPSHNPDKHVDMETPTSELLPGDPTQIPPQTTAANGAAPAKAPKTGTPKTEPPKGSTKPSKKIPAQLAPPATITRAKTPTRSPITAKTPTTGAAASKLSAPKPQHESSKKTSEKTATSTATAAATVTPKSGAKPAGSNKKPTPIHVSPGSGTGFVKPKVKSPTKPVKLPASLMAPTAASVSKVRETPRETLSRASGNQGRPASRTSTAGAGAPPKTLRRQNSVINRPRPSIGPPPKKPLQDHPITKKEKEIDESFLARMMRPTASSSSKLTEKAPVTPPRSRSARPSSSKKSSTSRSPKRALSRPSASRAGSPFTKREAPIKQVAPETAKVETAEAAAKLAEQAEAPRTPEAKAPATPEPIVEEEEAEAAAPEAEAIVEHHVEELDSDALAQQTAELSLQEGEAEEHNLKTPDEFEELLADEKEDKEEAVPSPGDTTTEVKTETA